MAERIPSDYPEEARVSLIVSSLNAPNQPGDPTANPPLQPHSYRTATEIIIAEQRNPYAEDHLFAAWVRWRDNNQVRAVLNDAINDWLRYLHSYGFETGLADTPEKKEQVRQAIEARVGQKLVPGSIEFLGRTFTVVEDSDLLRLGSFATSLISHLQRKAYVPAVVDALVAEEIMGDSLRGELMTWLLRTSPESLLPRLRQATQDLVASGHEVALRAVHRLLRCEGSDEAARYKTTLPPNPRSEHPIITRHREDPCSSGFAWKREDCEKCLEREELPPKVRIRMVREHVVDPSLSLPASLEESFPSLLDGVQPEKVWTSNFTTSEDIDFEQHELVLSAYAPEHTADLTRRAACTAYERSPESQWGLVLGLRSRSLVLDEKSLDVLESVRAELLQNSPDSTPARVEQLLAEFLLQHYDADSQLRLLLSRPEGYLDPNVALQQGFRGAQAAERNRLTSS